MPVATNINLTIPADMVVPINITATIQTRVDTVQPPGLGRIADAAYLVTTLPKSARAGSDDRGSSSDEDEDDDIDLSIKLEELLPKYIFPLVDKATKATVGR